MEHYLKPPLRPSVSVAADHFRIAFDRQFQRTYAGTAGRPIPVAPKVHCGLSIVWGVGILRNANSRRHILARDPSRNWKSGSNQRPESSLTLIYHTSRAVDRDIVTLLIYLTIHSHGTSLVVNPEATSTRHSTYPYHVPPRQRDWSY